MAEGNARRCSICATDWPDDINSYRVCPKCECTTDLITNGKPMDVAEAESVKNHAAFERYYAKHDAERQRVIDELDASLGAVTVDGPSAA